MAATSVGKIGVKIYASAEGMRKGISDAVSQLDRLEKATVSIKKSTRNLFALEGIQAAGRAFASIAGFATNVANSMKQQVVSANNLYDSYAKLGRRVGATGQEIAGLVYAADRSGVSFEQMTLAISTLERRFGDAAAGTQTYVNAFAQLGLSMEDLSGKTSAERFETVADAISRMATPAQQLAVSGKLFEEAGVKLVPLFQNGAKGLKAMVAEARSLGITLEGVDYGSFERIGDAFGRVQAQLTSIAARVAEKVAPTIERVAQVINEALDPDTADRFASTVAVYFEQAGNFLIDAADETIATLRPFYEYVTGANTEAAQNLDSFFTNVQNALRGVYGAFNTIGGVVLKILNVPAQLASLFSSTLKGIFDGLNIGGILGDNPFEGIAEGTREFADSVDAVAEGLKQAGRDQYSILLGMSDNIGNNVAGPVRRAFNEFSRSKPEVDVRGLEEDREARKKLQDAALRQQSQLTKTIERATSPAAFYDYNTAGGRSEFHRMERGGEYARLAGEQLAELKKIAENTVGSNLPEPVVSLG